MAVSLLAQQRVATPNNNALPLPNPLEDPVKIKEESEKKLQAPLPRLAVNVLPQVEMEVSL